jgi:hypothetical protein
MRAARSFTLLVFVTSMVIAGWASGKDRSPAPQQSVFLVGSTLKKNILFLAKSDYSCCCPADTAGEWEKNPRVMLTFANKATRPLWVAVTLTPPSSQEVCEHRGAIEAKGKTDMFFTQVNPAKGDYAVRIMAFADSAFADTVESTGWKVRPK